jgi:phytoene synthase
MTDDQAMSVLQSNGRSFYFAGQLLTPVHRLRAARLYAFCRYVDDIADELVDRTLAAAKLDEVRRDVQSKHSSEPCVMNMLELMRDASIPQEPVLALIDGVSNDVYLSSLRTESELVRYAYQVAGTVGLMMSMVLDVHDREAWPFAIDLGIAMQLTNIARDVGEDAQKGRVYLPTSWIGALDLKDIVAPDAATADTLRDGTQRVLKLAQQYYDSGLSGVRFLPGSARYGIVVAAMVYREIGQVIAQSGYQSWDRRAVVPHSRKLVCASKALTSHAIGNLSGGAACTHDGRLHEHLQDCFGADTTALA